MQSYAKNERSRANLALAVPKTLKPAEDMVEAIKREPEEEQVEQSPQDPPHTPTSFSFRGELVPSDQLVDDGLDPRKADAGPLLDQEEQNGQKYSIHRTHESINKLDSDSGSGDADSS